MEISVVVCPSGNRHVSRETAPVLAGLIGEYERKSRGHVLRGSHSRRSGAGVRGGSTVRRLRLTAAEICSESTSNRTVAPWNEGAFHVKQVSSLVRGSQKAEPVGAKPWTPSPEQSVFPKDAPSGLTGVGGNMSPCQGDVPGGRRIVCQALSVDRVIEAPSTHTGCRHPWHRDHDRTNVARGPPTPPLS